MPPVAIPARKAPGPPRAPFQLFALLVILTMAIAGVAYRYHRVEKDAIQHEVENQLVTIADLKVREISAWRSQHIEGARALVADSFGVGAIQELMSGKADRTRVEAWLQEFCLRLGFAGATVTDIRGETVLTVGRTFGNSDHLRLLAEEVLQKNDIVVHDFHLDKSSGTIHLGINLPLRPAPADQAFGALLLALDPSHYLYPLILRWPVPSKSGETLLGRREGDDLLYLNDLRFRRQAAVRLRIPLSRSEVPMVEAVRGVEGSIEGKDYRGVSVFAATRRIPDTPWFLVAKMDADEVQAPIRRRAVLLGAAAVSLILVAGTLVFLLWRGQQLRFYRAEYEAKVERQALVGHYGHLSRFANDIILLTDDSGRIVEANDRAVSTYGYSREELLNMTVRDLRHASGMASFDKEWIDSKERGSLVFETVHRSRDDRAIPVEVSVRYIEVAGKRFRQSIIRDTTERKAMDERLRRMLDTLSAVIEASPAAIVSLTRDFNVSTWNKAAERLFGWTAEEAIGLPPPFVPEDRKANAVRMHETVLRGEVYTAMHAIGLCKDGRRITMSLSAAPLHDPEGRSAGIALNLLDITEHMQAEEALQASESRFRRVVESAPEGIMLERDLRILYLNQTAVRMFGAASAADLLGRNSLELIHPEDRAGSAERSAIVAGRVAVPPVERRYMRVSGELLHVEVSAAPIEYDGKPASLVFLRDITERKRAETEKAHLETQLRQAQKMESLGRLAGGVAHDFNNHLTVITGYCDMLLSSFGPDDTVREEVEEIRAAGARATALTQQLLAFSRKQIAEPKAVNFNEVVSDGGKMLRRLIGEHVEIATDLSPELGLVLADRGQMDQVLMNLAINARDAMPSGGAIVIGTANVELTEDSPERSPEAAPGPYVRLSVSDRGVGMSQEALQHIFEPFFTTKGIGIGTGLGLSTVYGIVQQAHGWIRVSSQPGSGSVFRIYFPRAAAGLVAEEAAQKAFIPRGVETVLVVEDQPDVRRLALAILRGNGYQLLEAGSGPEALAVSDGYAGPIHLLLTDVVMPGMTGRELASHLMKRRPNMKVLYTSGYTANALGHEGQLDPGVTYLPKPFTMAQLSVKVREVLGRSKTLGTILVVDDDDGVRGLLQQVLAEAGYHVLAARDGKAGMRLAAQTELDLVLTDLIMPDQEGLETIRALRRDYPAIKIAAMSGAFDGAYLKTASMLGAQVTLRKPIQPEELLRVVRELLSP